MKLHKPQDIQTGKHYIAIADTNRPFIREWNHFPTIINLGRIIVKPKVHIQNFKSKTPDILNLFDKKLVFGQIILDWLSSNTHQHQHKDIISKACLHCFVIFFHKSDSIITNVCSSDSLSAKPVKQLKILHPSFCNF